VDSGPRPAAWRGQAVPHLRQARREDQRVGARARAARGRRAARAGGVPARAGPQRRVPRRPPRGVLRGDARGLPAHDGHAALRRPAHRRHGPPRRRDRRDEDGRGQDPHRHPGRGAQRAARHGRPRRHRQRLPRPPRRGVDEPDLRVHGPLARRAAEHAALRGEARRLCRRHHVRDELRVRLRLPARQHGDHARREGAVRRPLHRRGQAAHLAPVRDRRRGRQHPHRRGADPADHLRRPRAGRRPLREVRQARPPPDARKEAGGHGSQDEEGVRRGVRLRVRREAQDGLRHGERRREGGALPRDRPSLPRRERAARQPPHAGAQGRVALQARRRLRRGRRRGEDHRRVHGAHPRRPPLVGGPAPGRGGQGGRARPGGEPDPRLHHAAELLPHVQEARGHDRHGAHRGHRVHEDLQAGRRADPDEPAHDPQGRERPGLQDEGGQVGRPRPRDRRAPRARPARPRGHGLRRGLRDARRPSRQARDPPHRPQRQAGVRRARGRDHRRRGASRCGDHRDEHGRPRRRHQAGRQPRAPHGRRARQARPQAGRPRLRRALRRDPPRDGVARRGGARAGARGRRPVHLRHGAPRVAPDRQPAARPRRPPGRPGRVALLPLGRGRPRPPLRRRPHLQDPRPPRARQRRGRGGADRGEDALQADRGRPEEGRGAELPHPQARPRVRRRDEPAARGHLPVPRRGPRGPRHGRRGARADRRGHRPARRGVHPGRLHRGVGSRGALGPARPDLRGRLRPGRPRPRAGRPRRAQAAAGRRRAQALRAARGGARRGAHACARAVPDPPDHRPALARAPLRHGLPARGHPPARVRPDRPARRVQERGLHALPGPHELAVVGLRADGLQRRGLRRGRERRRPGRGAGPDRHLERQRRSGAVVLRRHARGPAERVRRRGLRRRERGGRRARARPRGAAPRRRDGDARPQRAVLVRLGPEVQEVPRRL
ncbi:MAG: Protein translocase subunit SecA, partial [uncultured Rubrobacteraceae bacterium]